MPSALPITPEWARIGWPLELPRFFNVGLGAWVVYIIAFPISDQNSDLRAGSIQSRTASSLASIVVGAGLLIRWARAHRTWRVILVPIAFVLAVLLAVIGTLLAINAVG